MMWHKEQYGTVHTCPFEPYAEYRVLPFSSFPPHLAMAASRNDLFSADCAISRKNKILNLKLADVRKSFIMVVKVHWKLSNLQTGSDLQMKWDLPWKRNLSPFWLQSANPMQQRAHCFQVCLFLGFI
jgi:hypothetical protein